MSKKSPAEREQDVAEGDRQEGYEEELAQYEEELAQYEADLARYLQSRIKPGLSKGTIPLVARSIAKELSRREPPEPPNGEQSQASDGQPDAQASDGQPDAQASDGQPDAQASDGQPDAQASDGQPDAQASDGQPDAQASDEQPDAQASDEQPDAQASDEQADFEADMHDLQAELGEQWILRFSVQGEDGWLTAEKKDASQRVEAPDAPRLVRIVEAINEGGGRQG